MFHLALPRPLFELAHPRAAFVPFLRLPTACRAEKENRGRWRHIPILIFAYRLTRGPGPLFAALCRKFTPVPGCPTSAAREVPPRGAEADARGSAPEGGIRAGPEGADGQPFAQGVRRVLRVKARAIARVRVRVEAVPGSLRTGEPGRIPCSRYSATPPRSAA